MWYGVEWMCGLNGHSKTSSYCGAARNERKGEEQGIDENLVH